MSSQERQPTRISLALGSTIRLNEWDFSKISVSLDRDLQPLENPLDGLRGIHVLLSKALSELQAGKTNPTSPLCVTQRVTEIALPDTRRVTENAPSPRPAGKIAGESRGVEPPNGVAPFRGVNGANGVVPPRPPASKLATLQERCSKHLADLEIVEGFDGLNVKPKRYLGESWAEINEVMRSLGGKWVKGNTPKDGCWRIPKSTLIYSDDPPERLR